MDEDNKGQSLCDFSKVTQRLIAETKIWLGQKPKFSLPLGTFPY